MVSSIAPAGQEARPPKRKPRSGGTPGFPKRTIKEIGGICGRPVDGTVGHDREFRLHDRRGGTAFPARICIGISPDGLSHGAAGSKHGSTRIVVRNGWAMTPSGTRGVPGASSKCGRMSRRQKWEPRCTAWRERRRRDFTFPSESRQTRAPSAAASNFYFLTTFPNQYCGLSSVLEKMMRSRIFLWSLISDTSGVTAIEYGLIAALIAVAAVVVMGTVGTNLSGVFSQVASSL